MPAIKLKVAERTLADKGPGLYLYGPWVTPEIHDAFWSILSANHRDDPRYHARQKCAAFFQGGSNDRKGKFVFIELWTRDPANWEDFIKIVNDEVTPLIDPEKWAIRVSKQNFNRIYETLTTDDQLLLAFLVYRSTDVEDQQWPFFKFMPPDNDIRNALLNALAKHKIPVIDRQY